MALVHGDCHRLVFRRGGRWSAMGELLLGIVLLIASVFIVNTESGFELWIENAARLLGAVLVLVGLFRLIRGSEKTIEIDENEVRITHTTRKSQRARVNPLTDYMGFVHFEAIGSHEFSEPAQIMLVPVTDDSVLELDSNSESLDWEWEVCKRFALSNAIPVLDIPRSERSCGIFNQESVDDLIVKLREIASSSE